MTTTAIVTGSLADVANRDGLSLAESFLSCEIIVLIDQSASMDARDAAGRRSRFSVADDELARIQKQYPGKVGVVAFSTYPQFCPGGQPVRFGASTDMAAALSFILPADGLATIVLISDGEPDSERDTLAVARRFQSPIHTVYIGPKTGDGRDFLARLAAATGGKSSTGAEVGLLADNVEQLLLAG